MIIFVLFCSFIVAFFLLLKFRKLSTIESFTGFFSRKTYYDFCTKNSTQEGITFLLKLNDLKKLNELYGSEVGDILILETSYFLKKIFTSNVIFRLSGNEFYIFCANCKHPETKLKKLKNKFVFSTLMKKYDMSFSAGYHKKSSSVTLEESFSYSNMSLSTIRKNNRSWYKEATEDIIKNMNRNNSIKKILEKSIKNEFYAVFQPKFKLSNNTLSGAEALARWENKDLGLIYPNEFIPLAENMGLIYKIDYKIAEEAIKKVKHLTDKKLVDNNFRLSFNMSPETFIRKDMPNYIFDLLKIYNVDGKNIEIEITESMILNNLNDAIKTLKKLKEKNILISMDDFTAGYSTIGLLATLPLDIVKFDRSLILAMNSDEKKGKLIYKGLISIMKSLNLKIVAEGIEKKEDFDFLTQNSVEYGQGFLLGKPVRDFLV